MLLRKIFAASLAATLSIASVASPIQSFGAAAVVIKPANSIYDFSDLQTACSKGGTYTIYTDVKVTKPLTVSKNLTLINKSEDNIIHCTEEMGYMFKVDNGATLKLGSATSDENRVIIRGGTGDVAKITSAIIVADNGSKVVINRGRIYRSSGSAIKVKGSSNLIMNEKTSNGTGNVISGITPAKSYYGAVHVCENSTFTMKGGTIGSKDASNSAGGVTIKPGSSMTMSGGTIHYNMGGAGNPTVAQDGNNVCTGYGAGIYNAGTLNMTGGTICDNNATVNGGGVYNNGIFKMSGGTIKNNHSTKPGQGIFISEKGKMDLSGSALVDTSNDIAFASETTPINVSSLLTNKPAANITLPNPILGAQVATVTAGQDASVLAENIEVNNKNDAIIVGNNSSIFLSKCFTLAYDYDGDGVIDSSSQLLYNDTFVVPTKGTISPKLGYDLSDNGFNGSNGYLYPYGISSLITDNLTLTGNWSVKKYGVTYNANATDAVINSPRVTTDFEKGFNVDFTNVPTRTGYNFIGWADNKDDADLNKPTYTEAQLVQNKYEAETTLYACWQPKSFTVTYDANATDAKINIPSASAKFDTGFNVEYTNIPTRTGYNFIGWADNKDDADLDKPAYNKAQLVQKKYETDVTLYACWQPKSFTVTYVANATDAKVNIPNVTTDFEKGFTVDFINIPTRTGYNFIGWADNKDDADLNKPTYTKAQLVQKKYEVNTTLYACWEVVKTTNVEVDNSSVEKKPTVTNTPPTVTNTPPTVTNQPTSDLKDNEIPGGNATKTDTTPTANIQDTTSTWMIQMENPSTKAVTLYSDVSADIKYNTTLNKALKFTLTGTRTNNEGTTNIDYYEYQLVKRGKEVNDSADAWKKVGSDNTITIKNTTAASLYICAHVGDAVTIYKTSGFVVDTTKPTVKGVKNGKTYKKAVTIEVKDNNTGIKSIKLNGKKIKSIYKLKKKGSYKLVVMDKAGNKTTMKFKIK